MQKVKFNKKIFAILLLIITLLLCTSVGITFSYFSDKNQSSTTMQIGRFNTTSFTAQDALTTANLVCGNTFTKNVTVTNSANIDYYIRVYATIETQVYENNTLTTKTNLVSVTNVSVGSTALTQQSGKFVYTTPVTTSTSTLTFTFTFKVSEDFTEELNYHVVGGNWTLDNTLKTRITYHAEVIQKEAGYTSWS